MSINSPLIILMCVIISLVTIKIISKKNSNDTQVLSRNTEIDGLRGFLALMVFMHHSNIWYQYINIGIWDAGSQLYNNIGKIAVVFFFMITGFLFFGKISSKDTNWLNLYFSRITRLTPMFMFTFFILLLIVFIQSNFSITVNTSELIISILRWLPFTALGMPEINNVKASVIVAGVPWSLVYEWFFYLSLPLLAIILRRKANFFVLFLSILSMLLFLVYPSSKTHVLSFLFGFAACIIHKKYKFKIFSHYIFSFISIFILFSSAIFIKNPYGAVSISLCGFVFIMISNGCDFFGLLKTRVSSAFGEITYSMYLLHGVVLYVTYVLIIGIEKSKSLVNYQYILITMALTIIVVVLSKLSFVLIEDRFSKYKKITGK